MMKKCPNCNAEVESNFQLCWNCNYSFAEQEVVEIKDTTKIESNIKCLRCQVPMLYSGNFKFHEGTSAGMFGAAFEIFQNKESFDIFLCPKCGKAEFFSPLKNDEYKVES